MGERTSHAPGTFSWVDLATPDREASKRFYGELFGWQSEDSPGRRGAAYTRFALDGRDVAGCFDQREHERDGGVPPHWSSYVTVEDLDAPTSRAPELGGKVVAEASEVEDRGRLAGLADPAGAELGLWEPGADFGAGLVNAAGALCWNDLGTPDVDAAKAFYGGLFGWTFDEASEQDPMQYTTIRNGETTNGSVHLQGELERGTLPSWLAYFATADLEVTNSKLSELGGRVIVEPLEVPAGGRVSVVTDPQGAAFGLFKGPLDP